MTKPRAPSHRDAPSTHSASVAALFIAATLACATANAQSRSAETGRTVDAAMAEFRAGHYGTAVTLFRVAYDQTHEAFILFNLAVSYERVGDVDHALATYREFIRALSPAEEAQRAPAQQAIARLEAARTPTTASVSAAPTSSATVSTPPMAHERPRTIAPERTRTSVSPLLVAGGAVAVASAASAIIVWALSNGIADGYGRRCVEGTGAAPASCDADRISTQADLDVRGGVIDGLWVLSGVGVIGAAVGVYLTIRSGRESDVRAVIGPNYVGAQWRF